jgi:hypothetical protein
VLAAVVGRRRRRVAPVVGGEDQQVVRPQRVEQVRQAAVEVLQAPMEVDRVVAMSPQRVGLDEVREDEPVVDRAQQLFGALDAVDVRLRRELLVDVLVREDVADLSDAVDLVAGVSHEAEVVRALRLEREVVPARAVALVRARLTDERPGDHPAHRVLPGEDLPRGATRAVELLERHSAVRHAL